MPKLDRLLNLDGGPSTGLRSNDIKILNSSAVRNYLVKNIDSAL